MRVASSRKGADLFSIENRADETPAAIALSAPDREPLTYRALRHHLATLRSALLDAHAGAGDITALALPNGPDVITAFLATSSTGGCAPLDPTLTETEYQFCLSRLGARTLIVREGMASPAVATA